MSDPTSGAIARDVLSNPSLSFGRGADEPSTVGIAAPERTPHEIADEVLGGPGEIEVGP